MHARALSPIRNVVFMGMGVRRLNLPSDGVVILMRVPISHLPLLYADNIRHSAAHISMSSEG